MNLAEQGKKVLDKRSISPIKTCFIHIRLGDTLSWPKQYGGSFLPATYFNEAIQKIKDNFCIDDFIILTDSPEIASKIVPNSRILSTTSQEAFALMHVMKYGIISASSFSLASTLSSLSDPYIIAPYYWAGHRGREWYPPEIYRSPNFNYIECNAH